MTDEEEEHKSRSPRSSSLPPLPPSSSITNESNSTIGALINTNPLPETNTTTDNSARNRRRSSVSILQALVTSSHLLATHDARRR
jgi:hypothetical protein